VKSLRRKFETKYSSKLRRAHDLLDQRAVQLILTLLAASSPSALRDMAALKSFPSDRVF